MIIGLLLAACHGLPPQGEAARAALDAALQTRDPQVVSSAARAAAPWRGKDPQLDRLLGDALANVLMRPDDGLPLLEKNPAPSDPRWVDALRGAALRSGNAPAMERAWAVAQQAVTEPSGDLFQQGSAKALLDPHFDLKELDDAVDACALLIHHPKKGRQEYSVQVPSNLIAAARALGATEIAMGRTSYPTDPEPETGHGLWSCGDLRMLPGDDIPNPLPTHVLVVGAADIRSSVFLELRIEEGAPWIFDTSDAELAARWVRASVLLAQGGQAKVSAELGTGLAGMAFPSKSAAAP